MYSLGIDFGSNAVRVLLTDIQEGNVLGTAAETYNHANKGVFTNTKNENVARQNADDYLQSLIRAIDKLRKSSESHSLCLANVQGIGIDATGSTPIPVKDDLTPISVLNGFENNLNAKAWMWKDHTSEEEAKLITRLAKEYRPEYLKSCGGKYSSEWYWAKILHCCNTDKKVFDAAASWIEFSDYIPAVICGIESVENVKRNSCAAGHKALYNKKWGGYPDAEFIELLHPDLLKVYKSLPKTTQNTNQFAGTLSGEWAEKLGMTEGIPVAMGSLDAHVGAIGAGVNENTLVKIIGTSTCDIITGNDEDAIIEGVSGIASDSVIPGYLGIEAGQSAVGDIFNWFVEGILGKGENDHVRLTENASSLLPGESGLLALDWNNGNRNILADPNLRGLIIGQSLHTKGYEIYRALIEATAFGAKRIIDQLENSGILIEQIICCGGIPQKNHLFMQIYADVLNRPVFVAKSNETVAFGAAMIGGVAAAKNNGYSLSLSDLQKLFCKVSEINFQPVPESVEIYKELYRLYIHLHDAFGLVQNVSPLYNIMKELILIKNKNLGK